MRAFLYLNMERLGHQPFPQHGRWLVRGQSWKGWVIWGHRDMLRGMSTVVKRVETATRCDS